MCHGEKQRLIIIVGEKVEHQIKCLVLPERQVGDNAIIGKMDTSIKGLYFTQCCVHTIDNVTMWIRVGYVAI